MDPLLAVIKLRGMEIAKLAKRISQQRKRIRQLDIGANTIRDAQNLIRANRIAIIAQNERIDRLLQTIQELKTRNHHLEAINRGIQDGLGSQNQSSDAGL